MNFTFSLHALPLAAPAGEGHRLPRDRLQRRPGRAGGPAPPGRRLGRLLGHHRQQVPPAPARRATSRSSSWTTFWQSKRLDAIYQAAEALGASPLGAVFRAGYVELSKVTQQQGAARPRGMSDELGGIENVERALKRAAAAEVTALERRVSFLGTTASAAPFVGLFGTVWGIMSAFHDIYRMGNANLATVARPISEALIATAVGLFAAIPAVVAYNFFVSRIRVLDGEMQNFSSDFLNIVRRHFFS